MMDSLIYFLIGFFAHIVDSALGMAFGTLSSSLLLTTGFPAHLLSATVHIAEIFGGGAATLSHFRLKNIDFDLLKKLAPAAIAGAIFGALFVTQVDGKTLKPLIATYFIFIGIVVFIKSVAPGKIGLLNIKTRLLGFIAGFIDAFAGSGWGEISSSGLVLKGKDVKMTVGSLNATDFMLSFVISIIFVTTLDTLNWKAILFLALGSMVGAPLGAWACKKIPTQKLMKAIGLLIIALGIKGLLT